MLGVDESHDAAEGLGLGEDLEGQSGLAAGLRAVDLDDAACPAQRSRARWATPTLFFTTLARTRLPTTSPFCLMESTRRISMRTDEKNLRARPPGRVLQPGP